MCFLDIKFFAGFQIMDSKYLDSGFQDRDSGFQSCFLVDSGFRILLHGASLSNMLVNIVNMICLKSLSFGLLISFGFQSRITEEVMVVKVL